MKSYLKRAGKKFGAIGEKMQNYWRRLMNHSKTKKMSEGAQQVNKEITSAHKDQWRRGDK